MTRTSVAVDDDADADAEKGLLLLHVAATGVITTRDSFGIQQKAFHY